jgi:hypothetical protein
MPRRRPIHTHPRLDGVFAMLDSQSAPDAVPRWITLLGSVAIAFHFTALTVNALAAPSGPWPGMDGPNMATPPQFAHSLASWLTPTYLQDVKLTSDYHFRSNRTGQAGVYFVVRLKDGAGNLIVVHDADGKERQLRFPDPDANPWVRFRQETLAGWLAPDQPVIPPQGEVIPAPHEKVPEVAIWEMNENQVLHLRSVPEHLVPRDRPAFRPTDWSMLAARSYARYLCRKYGAEKAEFIRHTREAMPPAVLFVDNIPASAFDLLVSHFGELPK